MVKSKLRKKFLKIISDSDKKGHNKQRNKCVSVLRKTKKSILFECERKRHSR